LAPAGTDLLTLWCGLDRPEDRGLVLEAVLEGPTAAERTRLAVLHHWPAPRGVADAALAPRRPRHAGPDCPAVLPHALDRLGRAAEELGRAVAAAVGGLRGPWRLRVEQLPVDDPAATAIASLLPGGRLIPGDGSPTTRFEQGRGFNAYVGHNSRGVAKTMRNRIKRAGMELQLDHIRDAARVLAALAEVEQVHRDRDLHLLRL